MKVLVVDNYDSFTYNLVHYLQDLEANVTVWRNDEFDLDDVIPFNKILLSPGPGVPSEAGLLLPLIKRFAHQKSILGICLGHQAIAEAFGGQLLNLHRPFHGVETPAHILIPDVLFNGLPQTIAVGRYHSWCVTSPLPDGLDATMTDESGIIMALKHQTYDLRGVQFHPESVMTPHGKMILRNWLYS